jgi:hypothetical protein
MRKIVLAALTAVLASPLAVSPPAQAANEVTVVMPGGVLYDDCGDYGFTYSAGLPAGYGPYWNMDLQLIGPDGNEAASAYVYGEAATGSDTFFLCNSPNLAGTYTVRGVGETCNRDYTCVPMSAAPSTVTFRLPKTRTSVTAKPKVPVARGQVVRFTIKSTDERPAGYFGTPYASVVLQARRGGTWRNVDSTSTNENGRAVITSRYGGRRVAVRVITKNHSDRTGSKSRTLWIG